MAFATYPRKGSISRSNIKLLLESDAVFNLLTDSQQSVLIDASVQRIAALRNSLSKTDYDFNTIGNADIDTEAQAYTKYIRYIIIQPATTYGGTLYAALTVLVDQGPTGFTTTLTVNLETLNEVNIACTGEFALGILWDANNAPVIVTRDNDNSITVDITDLVDVCILEIYNL